MRINDSLKFGDFEWRILDIQRDRILIITESIVEDRPYHDVYEATTWADCSLRAYLNHEFFNSFEMKEREKIIPVINKNLNNPWYGTKGGADTLDFIFLLSLEEVTRQYFGDSRSLFYHPGKNQRYWFERKDENNSKRLATSLGKDTHWWWLRSAGRVNLKASYIFGTNGNVGIQGNNITKGNLHEGRCQGGVRPAMWIRRG